jgi:hypothetical protein
MQPDKSKKQVPFNSADLSDKGVIENFFGLITPFYGDEGKSQ